MQRITSNESLVEKFKSEWKVLTKKIVKQAKLEATHNKRIAKLLSEEAADVDEDLNGKCMDEK